MNGHATDEEARAWRLIDCFVRRNAEALRTIAGQGDGRCGAIAEHMARKLLGPEDQKVETGRSRSIPANVRRLVMERDRYRCVTCDSHEALRIDHVHPWARGGSNQADNLQTLCHPCNQAKGARIEEPGR